MSQFEFLDGKNNKFCLFYKLNTSYYRNGKKEFVWLEYLFLIREVKSKHSLCSVYRLVSSIGTT